MTPSGGGGPVHKKQTLLLIFSVVCLVAVFVSPARSMVYTKKYSVSGRTMGTFYLVTLYSRKDVDTALLKIKIESRLKRINRQMSVFLESSEISAFNRASQGEMVGISAGFLQVMKAAQRVNTITGGAWDATVKPLLDLWKIKERNPVVRIPADAAITHALGKTGFHHIEILEKGLEKKRAGLTLDLGSMAKGYGVDAASTLLKQSGFNDFFVEIGGEVYAAGTRKKEQHWRVGISVPTPHDSGETPFRVVEISNKAVATSGTYRDFVTADGRRLSHIIDPRTGRPVDNGVVSVTVVSDTCLFADGLATAFLVMGRERGIGLADSLADTECMIVVKERGGSLVPYYSKGFSGLF